MAELEIAGFAQSMFVRTVRMAPEEKGVAYRHVPVMPQTAQVLALNPFGRVPAMRHGSVTLFESRAIGESRAFLDGSKHLRRYFERHATRPSFVKTAPAPMRELRR